MRRLAGAPRWLVGLAIVSVFLVGPLRDTFQHAPRSPLFARLETIAYDARLLATQPGTRDPTVVIVDIDEKSLQREGRWPWSRDRLALLTETLLGKYQARAVGFDVIFAERDRSGGLEVLDELASGTVGRAPGFAASVKAMRQRLDYDARFAAALADHSTVLAYTFTVQRQAVGALPPPAFTESDLAGNAIPIRPEPGYTGNLPALQEAAAGGGHIDPVFDSDKVVRRVPLVKAYAGGYYPALSLAVAQAVVEAKSIRPRFDANGDLEALDLSGLVVPVARDGTALVPYRGGQGTFRYFSASDILAGFGLHRCVRGCDRARWHDGKRPGGPALDTGCARFPRGRDPRQPARGHAGR